MKYSTMKQRLRESLTTLLILVTSMAAYGQKMSLSGVVKDAATGETIIGANILEQGTNNVTITNADGQFKMNVGPKAVLIVRYIGYLPAEVTVGTNKELLIELKQNSVVLGEVVAIGYGVQKKSDKTGAVMSVGKEEFNKGVLTDPIQAIQGKAAGVQITKKGGNPNDGFFVQIRGAGGMLTGASPVYVVDGVVGVDPTTIPSEEIETFNILKDASSCAIYGSRGANGIIIITTKKGNANGAKSALEINSYLSVDNVAKRLDLLSASDIRAFIKRNNIPQVDAGGNTDWQDEIYRIGYTQNHNVALSGNSEKGNYRISGTWSDFQGVVKGTNKQRFITTANVSQKLMNDKLLVDGGMVATFEENDYEDFGGNGPTDVMYQAFQRSPLQPVRNADGTFYENTGYGFQYYNPVAVINDIQNQRSAKRLRSNASAQYEIIPGLKAKLNGAYTRDDSESFYFVPATSPTSSTNGRGSRNYNNTTTKLFEAFVNYDKTFNNAHSVAAVAGYSWQEQTNDGFFATGTNAQINYVQSNNLQGLAKVEWGSIGSYKNDWRIISFFGRAAYDYKKTYFATATLRRDGSSKFGANKKWGLFPSVSLGWTMKNESFLKDVDWLSQLKLRVGYGFTGNTENFESYMSIPRMVIKNMQPSLEDGVTNVISFEKNREENEDFQWEATKELNIGLDWGLFNNKLQGSIEYYNKITDNLIWDYTLPQPPFVSDRIYANVGIMKNTGIEANIQYQVSESRNFNYKTGLVFSHNSNEFLRLSEGYYNFTANQQAYISARGMVGQWSQLVEKDIPLGTWYLPHYVGLSSDGKFLYKTEAGGVTRDYKQAARYNAGSAVPKVNLGWTNSFVINKNLDINLTFRSLIGFKVYNVSRMYFSNPTLLPNFNANQQAVEWYEQGIDGTPVASDYWLEDGTFLRLDNALVGYTIPNTSKLKIEKVRIYLSGSNLFTLTGYKGIDPEITNQISGSNLGFGLDNFNTYPKVRSVLVGLQLNF